MALYKCVYFLDTRILNFEFQFYHIDEKVKELENFTDLKRVINQNSFSQKFLFEKNNSQFWSIIFYYWT